MTDATDTPPCGTASILAIFGETVPSQCRPMKAVVCQNADLRVDELPEPVPAGGQVRLRVLRCGICGSDLHARTGSDEWAEMGAQRLPPLRALGPARRLRARVLRRGRGARGQAAR